jgi:CubicO group peptidase (beta-lactamase class C family)
MAEVLVPAIVGGTSQVKKRIGSRVRPCLDDGIADRPDRRLDDIWVHFGFTGTGMWISPRQRRWVVLVTNRLYYTRLCQPLTDIRNAFRAMAFR